MACQDLAREMRIPAARPTAQDRIRSIGSSPCSLSFYTMTHQTDQPDSPVMDPMTRWALHILVLVLLIGMGSTLRIHGALSAPNFDTESPVGMLRADPALLYYLVERVIDAGGGVPSDFAADPRLEHPAVTDIPTTFTVGQEFLIAWLRPWFDAGIPLHVFCVWVMGILASFAVIGVYGLALEMTGKLRWASAAALLYVCIPANYRTLGFVLIREDLSLPLLSLHFWWLARAARVRSGSAVIAASVLGLAAAATWHAAGFILALEMGILLLWFFRTGQNPLEVRGATIALAIVAVIAVLVPALRGKGFYLSSPVKIMAALWAVSIWTRAETRSQRSSRVVALAVIATATMFGSLMLSGPVGFSHVFEIIQTKIMHFGVLPADPGELSFEARLMWQGPFASMAASELNKLLTATLWACTLSIGFGLYTWLRRPAGGCDRRVASVATLSAYTLAVLLASLLFQRLIVLPGLLCPVLAVITLSKISKSGRATTALVLVVAVQLWTLVDWYKNLQLTWYEPPQIRAELRSLIQAIDERVPKGEPIACDFVNGAAILAHTGHPIMAQPKWESRRSLDRAKDFLMTFNHGTIEDVREMIIDRYKCQYAVFDRWTLWGLGRYTSGIPAHVTLPPAGTAASTFCSDDPRTLRSAPGFEAIYWSPSQIIDPGGSPTGWFRMYRLRGK